VPLKAIRLDNFIASRVTNKVTAVATVRITLSAQTYFHVEGEIVKPHALYQLIDRRSRAVLAQFPPAALDKVDCPKERDLGVAVVVLNPDRV
jgi:hypothetical protein